jgi:hypothetical protein
MINQTERPEFWEMSFIEKKEMWGMNKFSETME